MTPRSRRRRADTPMMPKPLIISIHVADSGTAVVVTPSSGAVGGSPEGPLPARKLSNSVEPVAVKLKDCDIHPVKPCETMLTTGVGWVSPPETNCPALRRRAVEADAILIIKLGSGLIESDLINLSGDETGDRLRDRRRVRGIGIASEIVSARWTQRCQAGAGEAPLAATAVSAVISERRVGGTS